MNMVPSTIKNNLAGLRYRERLLTLVWGTACWLSIALVLLLLCGLVDWLIDRQRETPFGVRVGLLGVQLVVAALAGLLFVFWPQVRWLPDTLLALWVESKIPQFQHRLISAVQLNQPGAKLDGMSKELVGVVTKEAEKLSDRVGGFAKVADHSRLKWTGFVLMPVVILFALPFAIWPGVCFALLARQALLNVDVPHSVKIESASQPVWPIGDKIKLYFRVTGEYHDGMVGSVHVRPEGQSADTYDLTFYHEDEHGAIFMADVAPSSSNLIYSARLADGRTKAPVEMRLVARPVIVADEAFVRLPAFCGLKPAPDLSVEERRYEIAKGKEDVAGIPGSSVRVRFEVASLKHKAWLVLYEAEMLDSPPPEGTDPPSKEKVKLTMAVKNGVAMKSVGGNLQTVDVVVAEVSFDIVPGLTGFRLMVQDENKFDNVLPPWRGVALVDEGVPTVRLLRDTFGVSAGIAGFDVEGLPVKIGYPIRIPYECGHKYGLGKAMVLYRILKKTESSDEPVQEDPWIRSPLPPEVETVATGPFNTKTGVFENTDFALSVGFHAVPSQFPDQLLGRTAGGGRHHLKTDGLLNVKTGKAALLKPGDFVEYCIEVYAANHDNLRGPNALVPVARSETRVSEVKTDTDFEAWIINVDREHRMIQELEKKQGDNSPRPK